MAKRGFFAELNYQAQQAEKRRRQQELAAHRAQVAAVREAERRLAAYERARVAAARASAAEQKAAEKDAARLLVDARTSQVEAMNADLASTYTDIDGLLAFTLDLDDYVDLEALKISEVKHPPFEPGQLGQEIPKVPAPNYPTEPTYSEPAAPSGMSAAFGGKKKHQRAVDEARADHEKALADWRTRNDTMYERFQAEWAQREQNEAVRLEKLAAAEATYKAECQEREAEASARNTELNELITGLAFDVESAIQEYIGIVLANSVYPDAFPVEHDHTFVLPTRELALTVTVPEPSTLPSVKEYKYVKARDEISSTNLAARDQKERYANAVWQVAVRTLHEVFEADRTGKIHSIALTVAVDTIAPATGQPASIPLVVVAADRETFNSFDLANVVPRATLEHLGAALSKAPFDLISADAGRGVRVRGQ